MAMLLPKNCLLQNRAFSFNKVLLCIAVLWSFQIKAQQIGNYVNNGSFENYFTSFIYNFPYYWSALDSTKYYGELLVPPIKVPLCGYTYQWPYNGKNHLITSSYSKFANNNRGYPRNRLKGTLTSGRIYCVTMQVNLSNQSTHGIDAIGIYFGDTTLDTIKKCNDPITYLTPQIKNPVNNIITDTMNWVPITGTFVANGTERFMLIGNFTSNANTNAVLTNTTHLPSNFSDYLIDAVSVIEVDLPAYAGPDVSTAPGHSVYIGRELDFAIDPGCVWFKLPEMTPIDTASGTWVQPIVTTTYVVRQILDCSTEKWDTVVVHMDLVGLEKIKLLKEQIQIYPVPASDYIELSGANSDLMNELKFASIYNNLGQFVKEGELVFTENSYKFKVEDLKPGAYLLQLKNSNGDIITKRFMVNR